jgi:hypothetical protein
VELSGELHFGLDALILALKCALCQLHAQLVFAGLLSLVLVLHVRVHIAVKERRAVFVAKGKSHALIRSAALQD